MSTAPAQGWAAAWEDALSQLEMSVATAERMLTVGHLGQEPPHQWSPPANLGPLPSELADRARTLLDRQIETARRIAEAADLNRRQSRAAQAMRATRPSSPVYLDTAA